MGSLASHIYTISSIILDLSFQIGELSGAVQTFAVGSTALCVSFLFNSMDMMMYSIG